MVHLENLFIERIGRFFYNNSLVESLALTRKESLAFLAHMQKQGRKVFTTSHFLDELSRIRGLPLSKIVASLVMKTPTTRACKKRSSVVLKDAPDRMDAFQESDFNPLIYDKSTSLSQALEEELQHTGVRVAGLAAATPDKKRPQGSMRTPGGHLVAPVCDVNGAKLYKAITPADKQAKRPKYDMSKKLPKLEFKQAEPVVFIATLNAMKQRTREARKSLGSLMGASAKEVFEAHGIEVNAEARSAHHWSHLVAHCLADPQELDTPSTDKERGNLIPATAASNYNMLGTVELYIREKLLRSGVNSIRIEVTPIYDDSDRLIPDRLIYLMQWQERSVSGDYLTHNQEFIFRPKSCLRFTQRMHESIEALRASSPPMKTNKPHYSPAFFAMACVQNQNDDSLDNNPTDLTL